MAVPATHATAATTGTASTTTSTADAISYLNEQRAANGLPAVTEDPGLVSWCPDLGAPWTGDEDGLRLENVIGGWSSTSSPWAGDPLDEATLYDPANSAAADATVGGTQCFGVAGGQADVDDTGTYAFVSESGTSAVPVSERLGQPVGGLAAGSTTGPQMIIWAPGMDDPTASVSLTTAAGVPVTGLTTVDASQDPADLAQQGDGEIVIAPVLSPTTSYVLSATWSDSTGATATQTVSFTTADDAGTGPTPPASGSTKGGSTTGSGSAAKVKRISVRLLAYKQRAHSISLRSTAPTTGVSVPVELWLYRREVCSTTPSVRLPTGVAKGHRECGFKEMHKVALRIDLHGGKQTLRLSHKWLSGTGRIELLVNSSGRILSRRGVEYSTPQPLSRSYTVKP